MQNKLIHQIEYELHDRCSNNESKITEAKEYEEQIIQAYTDGSKNGEGFGSGAVIFAGNELAAQIKLKLDSRCPNNQAEQLAIVKFLENS
jgi:hypothetical protein